MCTSHRAWYGVAVSEIVQEFLPSILGPLFPLRHGSLGKLDCSFWPQVLPVSVNVTCASVVFGLPLLSP